jgi:type IV pilus assembly protein PilQ
MSANQSTTGTSFFSTRASVYALCAAVALPAFPAAQGFGQAPATTESTDAADVNVTDYGTVDLAVQDTDLTQVLQMLSIQGKKNIITSKSVSATVTANLYDVTFYEALKAILEVNGYTFYEEGNFIYVITREEAEQMEKQSRRTESRIFVVQFLSAKDAKEFITPLLSEAGKASSIGEVQPGFKADMDDGGADNYAYSVKIVVNDYADNLDRIADLLTELDTPPQQVLVEAIVLKTKLNEDNAFGIDFNVIADMNFTDLTNPLSAVSNLINGDDKKTGFQPPDNKAIGVQSTVGQVQRPGGFKVGVISDDISVFLRVLDEVTDSTVLARPKVMALNRQKAQVLVGTRVGYLSTTATETTTTQSVSFLDTGINLNFRPFITTDGMIRLELEPKVSEASLRTVTDANGQSVTIPDEFTNQLTTNVRVKDGQTLILGGLFKEDTSITRRQVPLLGDVPVLGVAFRGQDDIIRRDEIIFLITPTIMQDQTLWAAGNDALSNVEYARVGARAGLLFFGETAMTDKYNQRAVDAHASGDNELALYYTNNSLRLSPDQPEMIRFREMLTGDKARVHERSMMENTFRKHLSKPANGGAFMPTPPGGDGSTFPDQPAMTGEPTESSEAMTDTATEEPVASAESQNSWAETQFTQSDDSDMTDPTGSDSTTTPEGESSRTTVVIPEDSSASALSPEQELFYQDFIHDFFVACGLPSLATCYVSVDDAFWEGTEFEQQTIAGAATHEPQQY